MAFPAPETSVWHKSCCVCGPLKAGDKFFYVPDDAHLLDKINLELQSTLVERVTAGMNFCQKHFHGNGPGRFRLAKGQTWLERWSSPIDGFLFQFASSGYVGGAPRPVSVQAESRRRSESASSDTEPPSKRSKVSADALLSSSSSFGSDVFDDAIQWAPWLPPEDKHLPLSRETRSVSRPKELQDYLRENERLKAEIAELRGQMAENARSARMSEDIFRRGTLTYRYVVSRGFITKYTSLTLEEFTAAVASIKAKFDDAASRYQFGGGDIMSSYTLEDFVLWFYSFGKRFRSYSNMIDELAKGMQIVQISRKIEWVADQLIERAKTAVTWLPTETLLLHGQAVAERVTDKRVADLLKALPCGVIDGTGIEVYKPGDYTRSKTLVLVQVRAPGSLFHCVLSQRSSVVRVQN